MRITGRKQTMKKSLLKATLICLGAILLCGMSSFKSLQGEKSQRSCRTASIVNDTIKNLEGENLQCSIKEVDANRDLSKCKCTLWVSEGMRGDWKLYVSVSCDCKVIVTYDYDIYYADGNNVPCHGSIVSEQIGDHDLNVSGSMSNSRCCPVNITARLAQE